MKKISLLSILTAVMVQAHSQTAVKRVFLEEFTTALCGNCPPQSYNILQWHAANINNSVMVSIHDGFGTDAMTSPLTDTYYDAFSPSGFGYAPAIMINRTTYPWRDSVPYMIVSGFDSIASRIISEPAAAGIEVTGSYNPSTRVISASVTTTFLQTVPAGNYRISLSLVEDSVVGSGYPAYDQKCYSSSFANTHYPGMYNVSNSTIIGYPHRHVLRQALLGSWGVSGGIPVSTSPVIGTPYSTTATYTVPSTYNDDKLYLVAYISHYSSAASAKDQKYVLNVNEIKLNGSFTTTAVQEIIKEDFEIDNIYPVPATDQIHLIYTLNKEQDIRIQFQDVLGRINEVIYDEKKSITGTHEVIFNANELEPGIYFVTFTYDDNQVTRKVIIK